MKECACGREFTDEQSSGDTCFKCKVSSVRFGFIGGGGYGRESFHNYSTREIEKEIVEGAKRDGREIQYKGRAWV